MNILGKKARHEIENGVDFTSFLAIKDIGVIEFLEAELESEVNCIKLHEAKIAEGSEDAQVHERCISNRKYKIEDLKGRIEARIQLLKDSYNYDYRGKCFYKIDEEHEMWLLEQQEGNYKVGTRGCDL